LVHGNYQLVERITGILEAILRISTIKLWDRQGKLRSRSDGRSAKFKAESKKKLIADGLMS